MEVGNHTKPQHQFKTTAQCLLNSKRLLRLLLMRRLLLLCKSNNRPNTGAQDVAKVGSQQAQSQLASTGQAQQAEQAPIAQAATQAGGSGFSLAGSKQAALGAVGGGGGTSIAPTNAAAQTANTGAGGQAAKAANVNQTNNATQFTIPQTDGIKFGGS